MKRSGRQMAMALIENMPFVQYRAMPGLNWSSLKHHDKSPAHFWHETRNQQGQQTSSMLMGNALHSLVLEGPATFAARYIVAPEGLDRRTKAGREAWAEFEHQALGKEILTQGQHEQVVGMGASIAAHPLARQLLTACPRREVVLSWADRETGALCKARLDALGDGGDIILDLKSTESAAPADFQRTIEKCQYFGQASFYASGVSRVMNCDPPAVVLLAVEKAPPHAVACYVLESNYMRHGRALVRRLLRQHAACVAANEWPAYPEELQTLSPPRWAQQELDEVTL